MGGSGQLESGYGARMHRTDVSGPIQLESLFDCHAPADRFVARVFPEEHGGHQP